MISRRLRSVAARWVWAGAMVVFGATGVQGQERGLELELSDAELEYNAARAEWESALNAFRAAEARWQRALDDVNAAEEAGDEEALSAAYARFRTQALEFQTQESRQEETARALSEARVSLMAVLAESRDALYEDALDDETPPEQRRELAALIQDRSNRFRSLEQEGAPPTEITLVTSSEITIDRRDGPDELNAKIRFMELRIRQAQDNIESVSDRISTLEKEQRQQRDLQNLMAGVERFDDTFVPVTTSDPVSATADREGEGRAPADGSDVETLDDLSIDQQIEALRLLQEQMFSWVQRMEDRVEVFRQRLIRLTTS